VSLRLPLQKAFPTGSTIDTGLLKPCIQKYGPVPRNVYAAYLGDENIKYYDRQTTQAIEKASKSFTELDSVVRSASSQDYSDIPHKLVCSWRAKPEITNTAEDFDCYVASLSPVVLDKILKAAEFESLQMKYKVCEVLAGIPSAAATRGYTSERYAHACLSSDESLEEFNVYALRPTSAAQW